MTTEFICEPIEVEIANNSVLEPVSFTWREKGYIIVTVKAYWQDWSLGGAKKSTKMSWRQRRHRNYFQVITNTGEEFEIYYDRGGKTPSWILANRMNAIKFSKSENQK